MLRKVIFSLVILCSAALIVFYLINQTHEEIQEVIKEEVSAVPMDAVAIMEINHIIDSWDQLNDGNLFYEELLGLEGIQRFDSAWQLVDSNFFKIPQYQKTFKDKILTYSLHPLGLEYNYLLSLPFDASFTPEMLKRKMKEVFPLVTDWASKDYEQTEINSFTQGGVENFFAYYKGFFLWSPSSILVENAIRTLDSGASILKVADYKTLKKTVSTDKNIHLFLDYSQVPRLSDKYNKLDRDKILNIPLGGWSEFDLGLKPNSMLLNGYILCPDSIDYYLNCFIEQEPGEMTLTEVMPYNTAWYLHANISEPNAYLQWNIDYWSKRASAKRMLDSRELYMKKMHWDPLTFQSMLGNELALTVIEPTSEEVSEDYAVFMQMEDPDQAVVMLDGLLDKYVAHTDNEAIKANYREFEYYKLGKTPLMELALGPFFSVVDNPYFVLLDDHMIVANSYNVMKSIINHYRADQTLAKDIHYNKFMDKVSEKSNLSIYSNIARAPYYYKNILAERQGEFIDEELDMFRQFQAISIQFEKAKGDKFYQTVYCKYNPIYKKETSSLWELSLDTTFSGEPYSVLNHNNQQKEIFFQDDREDLYLVGNTGKIVWKKKFAGKIIGKPIQIDRYQNQKLQMLFLTPTHIQLLDRNGHDVEGFPIELPDSASSELALMDYDNNNRWRLLVGCNNGNVYNYDINGEAVDGWAFGNTGIPVIGSFEHFTIAGKDYVLLGDDSGRIQLVNRKGEVRYTVSDSVSLSSQYFVSKRKTVDNTAIVHMDDRGRVLKSAFNGEKEVLIEEVYDHVQFIHMAGDKYIIGTNEDRWMVYDKNGSVLMTLDLEEKLTNAQLHINSDSKKLYLSGTSKDGLIFLYDQKGLLINGFPLTGSSFINVSHINNDEFLDLIVGDSEGILYSYTLGL